ncbi:hypothetical protein [Actinomadura rugatobispora]|uniref:TraR/DksA family transcriptional regulator n=1 Tax=Actinomadura rugatobispora TaxID=1994 RepID=A0ABW1A4F3_9ACTN|nr:hypothetical protein GCM10010200_107010 [Actinomadura rugatobispora]
MPEQIPDDLGGVGRGWHPLLLELHEDLRALIPDYRVTQVKEKYGTLRVYLVSGLLRGPYLETGTLPSEEESKRMAWQDRQASRLVHAAEERSGTICEACGAPGEPRKGAWIKTLCDTCHGQRPRRPARPAR